MPPKENRVTKKRKASSLSGQSTLDQYRRVASPSRVSRDVTMDLDSGATTVGSSMAVDSASTAAPSASPAPSLGAFRVRSPFDNIKISTSKARANELPEAFFETSWERHRELLSRILSKADIQTSLQQAYESCEAICRYGKSEELFKKLDEHLIAHVKRLAEGLSDLASKGQPILEPLNRFWTELCDQLVLIRNIFMELDRRYLIRTTKYSSLIALGKHYFNTFIMGVETVRDKGIAETIALIRMEREGNIIDRALVRSVTNMCLDLDLYTNVFEVAFLQDTATFYRAEAARLIDVMSVPQYLEHVRKRCTEEGEERLRAYLDPDTKLRLMDNIIDQLIYANLITILERGFDDMMDEDNVEPLHTLYDSVATGKGIIQLRAAFASYIKRRGENLIKDPKKDSTMITSLLNFRTKLNVLLEKGFNNDATFANALKESFEAFVNSRKSRPAELLAKFIDTKMRQSAKKSTEEDMDKLLDRLLVIFRYLQGKDTFEAFYKRFLSKRLLLSRSASSDMEKSVLAKLKTECGPGFTKNLEAMFKDIEVSADLVDQFKASKEYPKHMDLHFQVNVLAQGIWPTYAMSEIILPPAMLEYQTAFANFYTAQFKGRRLTWQNSLSSCVLKAYFPRGTKELTVSLLQTAILLLFNDSDTLSYADIFRATNLEDKELRRILQSLACGQHRVLLKKPTDMEINRTDIFTYNADFTAPNTRLKINVLQQEQTGEERKATENKVLIDRQHQIEAAIVRIMKAKKRLTHSELMNELFAQVKFPVEASDFKKRIESLIDREYLTRDEADSSVYVYC